MRVFWIVLWFLFVFGLAFMFAHGFTRADEREADLFLECVGVMLPASRAHTEAEQKKAIYGCALAVGYPWRELLLEADGDPLADEVLREYWELCAEGVALGPNCER